MTDEASKLKGLAWLLGALTLAAAIALGIAPVVRMVPWSWEEKMANTLNVTPGKLCHGNAKTDPLLKQLIARIYPLDADDTKFSVDIHVVNDPVVNAYAELGGQISLNKGLLESAQSPEEIAAILAHEIEHVHRRHVLQGVVMRYLTVQGLQMIFSGDTSNVDWADYFLNMSFSRTQEAEADEGALQRLQKAHVDNQGFKDFFSRMEKQASTPAFLSDHPADEDRLEMANGFANDHVKPIMTHESWLLLKHYCQ